MPIMPPTDPQSPSYRKDIDALWTDIRALWRRIDNAKGGSGLVIVQPDEPDDAPVGQLWYDTDEAT